MMSAQKDYWTECIEVAFEDAGIEATAAQIESVAGDVQGGHENYGMAFNQPSGPSQAEIELKETKRRLAKEQDKIFCRECSGTGMITVDGPVHSGTSQCWKCRGDGRHVP